MAGSGSIIYTDKKYGFSLRIPGWWKPYTVFRGGAGENGEEYELHLIFRYKEKTYGDIVTILVYPMPLKDWNRDFEDSPLVALAEYGGKVFAYVKPEELPHEFIDPETGEYNYGLYGTPIRLLKRMVNRDLPEILRTFRFAGAPSVKPFSRPYLSGRVIPGWNNPLTKKPYNLH